MHPIYSSFSTCYPQLYVKIVSNVTFFFQSSPWLPIILEMKFQKLRCNQTPVYLSSSILYHSLCGALATMLLSNNKPTFSYKAFAYDFLCLD